MLREKETKILALILSVLMLILFFAVTDKAQYGLSVERHGIANRLCYPFLHANLLHLGLNLWCFLSCVFLLNATMRHMILAFFSAMTMPATSVLPTIGLSGVCYSLLGMLMWYVPNKRTYNVCMVLSMLVPIIFMGGVVNNFAHVYCYIASAFVEYCIILINKYLS